MTASENISTKNGSGFLKITSARKNCTDIRENKMTAKIKISLRGYIPQLHSSMTYFHEDTECRSYFT